MRVGRRLSLSHELAEYFSRLRPDDLPAEVVQDARWRLLDTVGVALAGSRLDYSEIIRDVFGEAGGSPEATTLGCGQRLPAPAAGFVNGALAHGPDYDDTHSVAMVHISCLAVPAALAMAERSGAAGADMLTALVAGSEVGLRIGATAPHRFHMRGYHATGVVGPFVAATAGGRLLGLDSDRLAHALCLAGSQASGLLQGLQDGSWVKRLHPAWTVQAGLLGALLAERGFTGPTEVLEGRAGLYAVLLHGDEGPLDQDLVVSGLGSRWLLPETTYKPYTNGAWNHSSMDAVAQIMRAEKLTHEDLARIDATVPLQCIPIVCEPREAKIHPATPYHMKFSLPYSVALLAVLGRIEVDDYNEQVHGDPRIADLAARVHCHGDPAMAPERFPARVSLETRDGRRFERDMPAQRGGPGNPMTPDDHRAKFRSNARPSLGEERTEELLAAIESIWEAADVRGVAALLRPAGPPRCRKGAQKNERSRTARTEGVRTHRRADLEGRPESRARPPEVPVLGGHGRPGGGALRLLFRRRWLVDPERLRHAEASRGRLQDRQLLHDRGRSGDHAGHQRRDRGL